MKVLIFNILAVCDLAAVMNEWIKVGFFFFVCFFSIYFKKGNVQSWIEKNEWIDLNLNPKIWKKKEEKKKERKEFFIFFLKKGVKRKLHWNLLFWLFGWFFFCVCVFFLFCMHEKGCVISFLLVPKNQLTSQPNKTKYCLCVKK